MRLIYALIMIAGFALLLWSIEKSMPVYADAVEKGRTTIYLSPYSQTIRFIEYDELLVYPPKGQKLNNNYAIGEIDEPMVFFGSIGSQLNCWPTKDSMRCMFAPRWKWETSESEWSDDVTTGEWGVSDLTTVTSATVDDFNECEEALSACQAQLDSCRPE